MTLQALREKVGRRPTSSKILRRWYADNKYGNVTTADFISARRARAVQSLDHFFQSWLYEEV